MRPRGNDLTFVIGLDYTGGRPLFGAERTPIYRDERPADDGGYYSQELYSPQAAHSINPRTIRQNLG